MNFWSLVRKGLVLIGAAMVAGLMRDPMRGHLIPRDAFVNLLELLVLGTSVLALLAGWIDLAGERADRTATRIAGWLGILYLPVLIASAKYHGISAWGCGTARASSRGGMNIIVCTCLTIATALVVLALGRDRDRRRGASCALAVAAMWASVPFLGRVLDRDRTKPVNHRACYANQKVIVGAIEMYELDHKTKVLALDDARWKSFVSGGYMQSLPRDPDTEPPTSETYSITVTSPNGVTCSRHGPIQ